MNVASIIEKIDNNEFESMLMEFDYQMDESKSTYQLFPMHFVYDAVYG